MYSSIQPCQLENTNDLSLGRGQYSAKSSLTPGPPQENIKHGTREKVDDKSSKEAPCGH